jgi:hypothetical protein
MLLTEKLEFLGMHCAMLLGFAFACWGWGWAAMQVARKRFAAPAIRFHDKTPLQVSTSSGLEQTPAVRQVASRDQAKRPDLLLIAVGMGIVICILQLLGMTGGLQTVPVTVIFIGGGLLGAAALRCDPTTSLFGRNCGVPEPGAVIIFLAAISFLLLPFQPPYQIDELSYHLPHVQQWLANSGLVITPWLRYPWFPFNFELLYAAALLIKGDLMAHLVHAFAGWAVAFGIYQAGCRWSNSWAGCIAALIWLALGRSLFSSAYVDMGTAFFVFAACISWATWVNDPRATQDCPAYKGYQQTHWVVVSAFLLGVAAGTKYQVLGLLPAFLWGTLRRERRLGIWVAITIVFAVPCMYWYGRNVFMTGDPFDPLGGKILGFTDWNASDYAHQLGDLSIWRDWPSAWLWPAIASPLFPRLRRTTAIRCSIGFCAWALLVWAGTSAYPRYLLPVVPVLALLSAAVLIECLSTLRQIFQQMWPRTVAGFTAHRTLAVVRAFAVGIGLTVVAGYTGRSLLRDWKCVGFNAQSRADILRVKLSTSYGMLAFLSHHSLGKTYKFGMGEIYYAPQPIWGDDFGPWRYRDFLLGTTAHVATKLAREGFQTLVIRLPVEPLAADFNRYFEVLYRDDFFGVYRLRRMTP